MAIPDLDDLVDQAIAKFDGAASIAHDVANLPELAYISTESGLIPSLAEFLRLQAVAIGNFPVSIAALQAFDADLANSGDVAKGAAKIGRGCVAVDSIVSLLAMPTSLSKHISVASYHGGWAATTYGALGSSVWAWSATAAKNLHNGVDVISNTVPWNGSFATMDAFQAGTGETAPGGSGCWMQIHGANSLNNSGCIPFTGVNNFQPITRATARSYAKKRRLKGSSGTFEYGSTLDWSYPGFQFAGKGTEETVLKFTGAGRMIDALGTRPNNGAYSFGLELKDFTLEGNPAVTDMIRVRINHVRFSDLNFREASSTTGVALRVEGVVLGRFKNMTCSTNAKLMASRPLRGVVLDVDPTDGRRASANIWDNLIIEGMQENGIHFIASDTQIFNGGTSENCGGNGLFISPGCRTNTFNGVGFENFGYADVYDEGQMNRIINCYGTNKIYHGASSEGHYVRGGYWQNIEGHASALLPDIDNVQYNFLTTSTGTVSVASVTARMGRYIRNARTGTTYTHKKSAISISLVSNTPVTNTYGIPVDIYIIPVGGTVGLSLTEQRNGSDFIPLPAGGGKFFELPGDGIRASFTGTAPTTYVVPRS